MTCYVFHWRRVDEFVATTHGSDPTEPPLPETDEFSRVETGVLELAGHVALPTEHPCDGQ